MIIDLNKCGKLRSALKDTKMFPVGRTFGALSIFPASSFWFFAVFFSYFFLSMAHYQFSLHHLSDSLQQPFLQHRRYILVIGHALAQFSSKWKLQTLSFCRICNFCARCLQSESGLFLGPSLPFKMATDFEVCKFYNLRCDVTSSTCKTQIFEDAPEKTKHI